MDYHSEALDANLRQQQYPDWRIMKSPSKGLENHTTSVFAAEAQNSIKGRLGKTFWIEGTLFLENWRGETKLYDCEPCSQFWQLISQELVQKQTNVNSVGRSVFIVIYKTAHHYITANIRRSSNLQILDV